MKSKEGLNQMSEPLENQLSLFDIMEYQPPEPEPVTVEHMGIRFLSSEQNARLIRLATA